MDGYRVAVHIAQHFHKEFAVEPDFHVFAAVAARQGSAASLLKSKSSALMCGSCQKCGDGFGTWFVGEQRYTADGVQKAVQSTVSMFGFSLRIFTAS